MLKGGQNTTCQAYNAISQSTTNHVYSVAVPSLETITSTEVLWKSTVTLNISVSGRQRGTLPVNYGVTDALAPFPLHSLVNVMSATMNNTTVSFNAQETLPLLLCMVDPEELSKYDSWTPTALGYLADYMDGIQRMSWPLDIPNTPCGIAASPNILLCWRHKRRLLNPSLTAVTQNVIIRLQNHILAYDMNRTAGPQPAWVSWLVKQIYMQSTVLVIRESQ